MSETCFVITPIGASDSPKRRRADRLCDEILLPALDGSNPRLVVERGDRIQSSGPITVQLVEQIADAKLIVADLVDPNPNVYYELGIAESFGKPTIRFGGQEAEALPFDVRDMRTIPLPKHEDGRIDVVDANRCIKSIRKMLPEMLDPGYRPNSVVSLAGRQARFNSLTEALPSDGDNQAVLLRELATRMQDMTLELEAIRSDVKLPKSTSSKEINRWRRTRDPWAPVVPQDTYVKVAEILAEFDYEVRPADLQMNSISDGKALTIILDSSVFTRAQIAELRKRVSEVAHPILVGIAFK